MPRSIPLAALILLAGCSVPIIAPDARQAGVTGSDSEATAYSRTRTSALDASWEIDLFGRASKLAAAERTRARAEDDAGAYVSLSAEEADTYVQYRACRMTEQVYPDASASQAETLDGTSRLVSAGLRAEAVLALARVGNPDLQTAAAQVMAARARAGQQAAGLWPDVTGKAGVTDSDSEATAYSRTRTAALVASWEIDLFGRASKLAAAERTRARAEDHAYAGAYVSLSAEVADTYVQYRACQMTEQVCRDASASQAETLDGTSRLVSAGLRAEADLALARANQASARISLDSQAADCRVLAQSLTVLTASTQARIDDILSKGGGLPPAKPFKVSDVPADMLRQQPDIAVAELTFAATLLDVGVAKADLYPSLTLTGRVTLTDPSGRSFGPALSLPVFDGGQRRAAVQVANADAIVAAEAYRTTVLTAVAETEAALTRLNAARRNVVSASTLIDEYGTYFAAIDADWQAGTVSLLDREEARRQVQSARITQVSQHLALTQQWIALYKAMGGGWQRPAAATVTNGA